MPAVYEVRGRQYVVFYASAQVALTPGTPGKIRRAYVAFPLPKRSAQANARQVTASVQRCPMYGMYGKRHSGAW